MVYPVTGLPLVVEIAPGANSAGDPGEWPWVDVTDDVRIADGIHIDEGRGDWGSKVDPGSIALTFDNRPERGNGNYSEYNPLGQWYGSLGRDTPLRVRLRRGEDAFGRTTSNGLGTSDSGQVWTTPFTPSAWSTNGSSAQCSINSVNSFRRVLYAATLLDAEQRISVTPSAAATGAPAIYRLIYRYVDSSNYYAAYVQFDINAGSGLTVRVAVRRHLAGVQTDIATALVPGLLYVPGQPVHLRAGMYGQRIGVKAWSGSLSSEPVGWTTEVDDYSITVPGQVGMDAYLAAGNTNTSPYLFAVDNYALYVDLAGGFVPAWVPRWDRTSNDRTVPVVAKGVSYRSQPASGTPPSRSAMRRVLGALTPAAYWPVEDGQVAGQAASAISGHPPMNVTGVIAFEAFDPRVDDAGVTTVVYGSAALADLSQGGSLSAAVPGDATAACASGWTLHVLGQTDITITSANVTLLDVATPGGTYVRYQLILTTGSHTQLVATSAAGVTSTLIDLANASVGVTMHSIAAVQSGSNIEVRIYRGSTATYTSATVAGTITGPARVAVNSTFTTCTLEMPVGHVALFPGAGVNYPDSAVVDTYGGFTHPPLRSWLGEPATDRLPRLAGEDGIALTVPVPPSYVENTRMGWQPVSAARDLYQQCVDVDGGYLYERPFRLEYLPREYVGGQTPAIVATIDQLGQEPEPDPSGQGYRNRWEVKRTSSSGAGSSAVAESPEVAAGQIVYSDSADLNLSTDDPLPHHAGHRLHLSSLRAMRWPKLALNLAATPELIDAWLCCRPGSRIQVTNPPEDVAGQDIDVLLEGHSTVLGYKDWDITANCSPAQQWTAAVVDGEPRVASDGSTVAATLTVGATSLSLASTTANGLWTTSAGNFPLALRVGGEKNTASVITGGSSPQSATVSRAGNGITHQWNTGTDVDVWSPAIVAL